MKSLKVGIVGLGFAGRFHADCLRRVYGVDVEIAGVTDLNPESREKFGKERGISVYEDIDKILPHVDVINICTPPYVHADTIIKAANAGKAIVCEKPLTGSFGPEGADETYRGDKACKKTMQAKVLENLERIADTVRDTGVFFGYAENFVYCPSVQKEREIIEKTGSQILRMMGEESHNGSESSVYGIWRYSGGGSLIGKGCHPLSGMLYLKRVEGLATCGKPIRPRSVISKTHQLTRLPEYRDLGFIRTDYHDVEDYGFMHVTFEDGTVADVLTGEVVLGGIYDYVEVFANNHRTRCHISPTHIADSYNPQGDQFNDIYMIEKSSTKEGWSPSACDEYFSMGYQGEIQDFMKCAAAGMQPQSDLDLALDTTATIYSAYVSDEQNGKEVKITQL